MKCYEVFRPPCKQFCQLASTFLFQYRDVSSQITHVLCYMDTINYITSLLSITNTLFTSEVITNRLSCCENSFVYLCVQDIPLLTPSCYHITVGNSIFSNRHKATYLMGGYRQLKRFPKLIWYVFTQKWTYEWRC